MKKLTFYHGWMKTTFLGFLVGFLGFLCICNQNILAQMQGAGDNAGLKLPKGFKATVFANATGHGRHMAINSNGDVYVSLAHLKDGHGIVALRDTNNDGKADVIKYFGKLAGTGIGIHNGYLYFGADTILIRYKLIAGRLLPDPNYQVVAGGFLHTHEHEAKPITFDNQGHVFINFGAPSNACQEQDRTPGTPGQDPCPLLDRAGGIWRFDADKTNQDQVTDGYRYASGLRNCMALAWNFSVNRLYVVQHGRDQLHQLWPAYYSVDDGVHLPAEEFFLLKDGSNCGWPYCYFDGRQNKKLLAPEYGGNGKTVGRCSQVQMPIMTFPAHYAPNCLLFYSGKQFPKRYRNGAFIAFHGSWNRAPEAQKGYNVVFVPFKGTLPSGKWEVFADGFAGKKVIMSPRDAKYRPCGLAVSPDGSLFVVDDTKGRIWKISYR